MKTRSDFVSNSSSASFVLVFKCRGNPQEDPQCLQVYDIYGEDIEVLTSKITGVDPMASNGSYYVVTVEAHISMFNNFHDFPKCVTQLWMFLQYNYPAEIVNLRVEDD